MYIGIDGEKEPVLPKREPQSWERFVERVHKVPSRAVSVKPFSVVVETG